MYTTKTKFKGQDAFTKTGFLHVGDKYIQKTKGKESAQINMFGVEITTFTHVYIYNEYACVVLIILHLYIFNSIYCTVLDPRFKGKQFTAGVSSEPFGKFASLNTVPGSEKYVSDPYTKASKGFKAFVPNEKGTSGFGSKDAAKRAEFSDTLAVRVYKEKLKSEQKYAAIFARKNLEKVGGKTKSEENTDVVVAAAPVESKSTLFDAIFENKDEEKQDRFMKPKKTARAIDRGTWKTTAEIIGQYSEEANHNGISFGRQNKMKDTFDHGHIGI